MAQARTAAGFTLIELAIALAIVAIMTAIAASSYRGYLRRGHRWSDPAVQIGPEL